MFARVADGSNSAGLREQRCLAGERLTGRRVDLDRDDLARLGEPLEVHDLVVRRAPAKPRWVIARLALDEHIERAPDESLRALARPPLHDLDEPLHALDLNFVRDEAIAEAGGLGVAPRRVDERERAVEADLL